MAANRWFKAKNIQFHFVWIFILAILVLRGLELASYIWQNAGTVVYAQTFTAVPDQINSLSARAETRLRQAIIYTPENRQAWRQLGFVLTVQGREDEALTAWEAVGGMSEEMLSWWDLTLKTQQYEKAQMWHQRLLRALPNSAESWYHLGLAYERQEEWANALQAFQQAQNQADSQNLASSLDFHIGKLVHLDMMPVDLPLALEYYDKALVSDSFVQTWERVETHYLRGDILRHQERLQEALEEFRYVVTIEPNHYRGNVLLGWLIWKIDRDTSEAEKYMNKAINLNPELKLGYSTLVRVYIEDGRLVEAAEVYRHVLGIDPGDEAALQFFSRYEGDSNSLP